MTKHYTDKQTTTIAMQSLSPPFLPPPSPTITDITTNTNITTATNTNTTNTTKTKTRPGQARPNHREKGAAWSGD